MFDDSPIELSLPIFLPVFEYRAMTVRTTDEAIGYSDDKDDSFVSQSHKKKKGIYHTNPNKIGEST